jgi:hypothetical protein
LEEDADALAPVDPADRYAKSGATEITVTFSASSTGCLDRVRDDQALDRASLWALHRSRRQDSPGSVDSP